MKRTNIYIDIFCYLLLISLIFSTSCATKRKTVLASSQSVSTNQPDTAAIPLLPAEVIYMLGMEWLSVNDSSMPKYNTDRAEQIRKEQMNFEQYTDLRLHELYPDLIYEGYTQKVTQMFSLFIQQTEKSNDIRNEIGKELPLGVLPEELNNTQLTHRQGGISISMEETIEEMNRRNRLDSLAQGAEWVDINALDTIISTELDKENLLMSIMLHYGPDMFYRVILSKARAEYFAKYYYGDNTSSGKRGDAFKHIYVNCLLRNYTSKFMSWLVMDVFWENTNPNAPCDRYMDLHNNIVGRDTYYDRFIKTNSHSMFPSWQQWAENVHAFIEDTTKNSTYQRWSKETPSFIVIENEKRTSSNRYIYWNKQQQ